MPLPPGVDNGPDGRFIRVDPDEQRNRRGERMREGRARKRRERIAVVRANLPALGIDPAGEDGQRMLRALERLEAGRG